MKWKWGRAPLDERTGSADRYLICLGILSGLALWCHLLFIIYLIPVVLYILLRDWKVYHPYYVGISNPYRAIYKCSGKEVKGAAILSTILIISVNLYGLS